MGWGELGGMLDAHKQQQAIKIKRCWYYKWELLSDSPRAMRSRCLGMGLRSSLGGFDAALRKRLTILFATCSLPSLYPQTCAGLQDKAILR